MTQWSQSPFLQALGWATLNSFWQMALLWCAFVAVNRLFSPSASARYRTATVAIFTGFGWFLVTFLLYYFNRSTTYALFATTVAHSNSLLNACLLSASTAYLLLLVFPAVRLFRNWRFVQAIKHEGLEKASLHHRLFVRNIAGHLGISKKVKLAVSHLVSSPLTVGYLKPIILLPVAALNNLTTAQVEAVLLHELSHIRRYDYLVNFIVSVIHTLLYFNPFVKLFVNAMEAERETCCDELVLQFGYDKVDYASALLQLEKASGVQKTLVLAASGRQNLLTRIEKIVGMEQKKTFRFMQIVPLLAALVCILLFNSVLIIEDVKTGPAMAYTSDAVFVPWPLDQGAKRHAKDREIQTTAAHPNRELAAAPQLSIDVYNAPQADEQVQQTESTTANHLVPVTFDEVDGALSKEEKETVEKTVEATKKVAGTLQWKEIETAVGDLLTAQQRVQLRQQYQQELENLNWQNVERNMKANYDNINWPALQENLKESIAQVRIDSMQTVLTTALKQLDKATAEADARGKATAKVAPMPDCSIEQIDLAKQTLRRNLDSLKAARPKKVVHL